MEYTDKTKKPYPFCPGCTHGMILDAVDRTLANIGADPRRTVLVSDIGCVGMADKYFNTHTFHGLHGRSFTYACGVKMARPDLNVFALVGDGGCGIGGNHLINAARRNVGITVICFNNFNFGMTGGEHSVTTPLGGKTNTTLAGSIEPPLDLCSLVMASGGTFVARKTAFDKDLDDVIARAMGHKGFSFVDVWEVCTAYYSPMNAFKKSDMEKYMADNGLKTGVLSEVKRPEYSSQLHGMMGSKKPAAPEGIKPKFAARFSGDTYNILLAGSAGMKVVSAAATFGRAGLLSGLWAAQKDEYPVTVQVGHSLSTVKFSKKRIHYLGAARPNAVVIISEDGIKRARGVIAGLGGDDLVIIDNKLGEVKTGAQVLAMDLNRAGLTKANKAVAAIAGLLKTREIIELDAYKAALESIPSEKIRNENLKAYEIGVKTQNPKSKAQSSK